MVSSLSFMCGLMFATGNACQCFESCTKIQLVISVGFIEVAIYIMAGVLCCGGNSESIILCQIPVFPCWLHSVWKTVL